MMQARTAHLRRVRQFGFSPSIGSRTDVTILSIVYCYLTFMVMEREVKHWTTDLLICAPQIENVQTLFNRTGNRLIVYYISCTDVLRSTVALNYSPEFS